MRAGSPISLVVLCAVLSICAAPAVAQFPSIINYQVMLTDDEDQPLADQPVELVFRFYQLETGGSASWTETHNTTTNSIGVASVILGSITPISLDAFPGPLWLEIEVDGETLSPRRRLTSAPYAIYSDNTRRLGGTLFSEYATDDELSAYALLDDLSAYATLDDLSDYATEAELSTPGSVNDPGNPVDWTKLKNVPAGFADGADAEGGAGDGHSLDAWDGDPVDAVWVGGNGKVGMGTTSPSAQLHVHKDTLYTCSLRLTTEESGVSSTDGLELALIPFGGTAVIKNHESAPLFLSSGDYASLVVRSDGSVDVCPDVALGGELNVYGSTSSGFALHRSFEDDDGGQFELKDEQGNIVLLYEADGNGVGGRLLVQRDDTFSYSEGIDLNGNWGGSGEPALLVMGSSRSARFEMEETGDESVVLPADAISSAEIMDEPGVAGYSYTSTVSLSPGSNAVGSRTITVPCGGYILVIGSGQADTQHTTGNYTDIDVGVSSNSTNLPSTQNNMLTIPSSAPSGGYNFPVASHGLFEVNEAGSYTFYMLAWLYSGEVAIRDPNLTLLFTPTAYGTVSPSAPSVPGSARGEEAPGRTALSQAEIEAERAESRDFNLARIERELEEIRAQVEAMREEPR